jgi:hypothetical protein
LLQLAQLDVDLAAQCAKPDSLLGIVGDQVGEAFSTHRDPVQRGLIGLEEVGGQQVASLPRLRVLQRGKQRLERLDDLVRMADEASALVHPARAEGTEGAADQEDRQRQ